MAALIKKEIQALENIKNFGNVLPLSKPISVKESMRLPFYPPPAFSYAFSRPRRTIKIGKYIKAFTFLNKYEADLIHSAVGTRYVIVLDSRDKSSFDYLKNYFRPSDGERVLCAVALSRNSKKIEELRSYRYGTGWKIKFEVPHEIKKLKIPILHGY